MLVSYSRKKGLAILALPDFKSALFAIFASPTKIWHWAREEWRTQLKIWRQLDGAAMQMQMLHDHQQNNLATNWSPMRINAAEEIWGVGLVQPEPQNLIRDALRPMGSPPQKFLELGCHLGEISRFIAREYGCAVTAMESDPDLAQEARERCRVVTPNQNVAVLQFDPFHPNFAPDSYDLIFCRDQIAPLKHKAKFLSELRHSLRQNGQCLLLETVLRADHPANRRAAHMLHAWYGAEATPPDPLSLSALTRHLVEAGFRLRLTQDVTEAYKSHIGNVFAALPARLVQADIPQNLHNLVMREVERIGAKAKAFESGGLAVYLFHAEV